MPILQLVSSYNQPRDFSNSCDKYVVKVNKLFPVLVCLDNGDICTMHIELRKEVEPFIETNETWGKRYKKDIITVYHSFQRQDLVILMNSFLMRMWWLLMQFIK